MPKRRGSRGPLRRAVDAPTPPPPPPGWVTGLREWIGRVPRAELEAIRRHLAELLEWVDGLLAEPEYAEERDEGMRRRAA
jgi:hypothetical protein